MDDESDLVRRCVEGDEAAWAQFVERYGRVAVHVIVRRLRMHGVPPSPPVVDDICAETFRAFIEDDHKLLRRYNPQFALATWVGIVARTQSSRHLRRLSRRPVSAEDLGCDIDEEVAAPGNPSPAEHVAAEDSRRAVREVMSELSERDRQILELFYWQGEDYDAIARILGVSKNSVGAALTRARARLQRLLEERRIDFT